MVGGQDFDKQPVQPRHQRPAPARLLVQAVHARHRAQGGPLARRGLRVGAAGRSRSRRRSRQERRGEEGHRPSSGSTTTTTTTSAAPRSRPRPPTPTTPSTPSSASRSGSTTSSRPPTSIGINSPLDDNPAMILGGLKTASRRSRWPTPTTRSPTAARGSAAPRRAAATARARSRSTRSTDDEDELVPDNLGGSGENEKTSKQVIDPAVAQTATDILHTVVTSGTGEHAQVGDDYIWGKTGTTDNNADAWFVGANEDVTVAVWVGYPDGATPMPTEFGGAARRRRHDPGADLARRRLRLRQPAGVPRRRRRDRRLDRRRPSSADDVRRARGDHGRTGRRRSPRPSAAPAPAARGAGDAGRRRRPSRHRRRTGDGRRNDAGGSRPSRGRAQPAGRER